jgi:type IX secretion system PorP/SprF family membrane protein
MKQLVFISLLVCSYLTGAGQQLPVYSLYDVNKYISNPAFAGSEYYWDFTLQNRSQWVGFDNGPSTQLFSSHSRIEGTASGFGATFYNDRNGVLGNMGVSLGYAYHLNLSDNFELSFGLNGSYTQYKLYGDRVLLHNVSDNLIEQLKGKSGEFNTSFGTLLYSENFYFGLSTLNLLSPKIDYFNGASTPLQVHYYLQTGGRIPISSNGAITASLLCDYLLNNPFQADMRIGYEYVDIFKIGAGYRWGDAFIVTAGIKIVEELYLNYAYDMGVSPLNSAHSGSHEVVLAYHFYYNPIYKNSKARYNFKRIKKRAD